MAQRAERMAHSVKCETADVKCEKKGIIV